MKNSNFSEAPNSGGVFDESALRLFSEIRVYLRYSRAICRIIPVPSIGTRIQQL